MPNLDKRFEEIEQIGRDMGLDFFPVVFEMVPREIIWDVASYGLPTRMSHWSFGRTFTHQKMSGEMGFGKIYELIINNDPSYAFLDDTNEDSINLLVAAHCYGHSHFFKNNVCFSKTNRNMVNQAERNAKTIDQYKQTYGVDAVEDWMDVAFSLERHIDPILGEDRRPYPEIEHTFREIHPLPYSDLFGEDGKPHVVEEIRNTKFPPHPESDIMWFLTNYAKMLPWQREVMSIIRSEAYYFYPQGQTKIMNEGWASFWHAEIMMNYDNLSPAEHMDFAKAHSGVLSPGSGGQFNPYYVGFRILGDIRKRWDDAHEEAKKDAAFMAGQEQDKYDENGKLVMSKIDGMKKLFEVCREEDDYSFIQNYLTRELAEDMEFFTYGLAGNISEEEDDDADDIIIKDRELHKVKDVMTSYLHHNGAPPIAIDKVEDNTIHLMHDPQDKKPLDDKYAQETLKYIHKAWKGPVVLRTRDRFGAKKVLKAGSQGVSEEKSGGTKKFKFNI